MLRKQFTWTGREVVSRSFATILVLCWTISGVAVAAAPAGDNSRSELAVIVNPKVPVDNLSMSELRRVMTGDKQYWSGDNRVTVLVPGAGMRERAIVLKAIYQMTETQYRQFWLAKRFRQEALSEPKAVDNDKSISELIASVPGTISVTDSAKAPSGVKVIRVDKLLPGQKDYPVH